ncbi:MAG: hypothetical protein ACREEM_11890, partial [Blastocatellia bacterium]
MWTMTLILCFIGFCATLAWALYSRLSNGATLAELMRTRCQEVFPVRALIWLLFAFACGCSLIGLALLFAEAQALWRGDESPGASISRLIAYLISFALLCASCWWIWLRLAVIGELDPVQVDDGRATFIKGILEDDLSVLGSERFPNLISPEQRMDNIVRWLVLSASAGVLVYFGYQYRAERADVTVAPLIPDALPQSVTAANGIGWFLLVTCGMLLAVSLVENRDYTFVPFRPALALQIGLCGIFLGSLYLAGEADVAAPMGLGVLCGAMGIRAAAALWRWRKYRKTMKVYKPIAETLEMDVPYLDEIAEHPDFRLPDP